MPHTPEPWTLTGSGAAGNHHFGIYHRSEKHEHWPDHDGHVICTSVIGDLPADQNFANGELLVRAPRLARVLSTLLTEVSDGFSPVGKTPMARAMQEAAGLVRELQEAGVL
jgi:hypothetical protein